MSNKSQPAKIKRLTNRSGDRAWSWLAGLISLLALAAISPIWLDLMTGDYRGYGVDAARAVELAVLSAGLLGAAVLLVGRGGEKVRGQLPVFAQPDVLLLLVGGGLLSVLATRGSIDPATLASILALTAWIQADRIARFTGRKTAKTMTGAIAVVVVWLILMGLLLLSDNRPTNLEASAVAGLVFVGIIVSAVYPVLSRLQASRPPAAASRQLLAGLLTSLASLILVFWGCLSLINDQSYGYGGGTGWGAALSGLLLLPLTPSAIALLAFGHQQTSPGLGRNLALAGLIYHLAIGLVLLYVIVSLVLGDSPTVSPA